MRGFGLDKGPSQAPLTMALSSWLEERVYCFRSGIVGCPAMGPCEKLTGMIFETIPERVKHSFPKLFKTLEEGQSSATGDAQHPMKTTLTLIRNDHSVKYS